MCKASVFWCCGESKLMSCQVKPPRTACKHCLFALKRENMITLQLRSDRGERPLPKWQKERLQGARAANDDGKRLNSCNLSSRIHKKMSRLAQIGSTYHVLTVTFHPNQFCMSAKLTFYQWNVLWDSQQSDLYLLWVYLNRKHCFAPQEPFFLNKEVYDVAKAATLSIYQQQGGGFLGLTSTLAAIKALKHFNVFCNICITTVNAVIYSFSSVKLISVPTYSACFSHRPI